MYRTYISTHSDTQAYVAMFHASTAVKAIGPGGKRYVSSAYMRFPYTTKLRFGGVPADQARRY